MVIEKVLELLKQYVSNIMYKVLLNIAVDSQAHGVPWRTSGKM